MCSVASLILAFFAGIVVCKGTKVEISSQKRKRERERSTKVTTFDLGLAVPLCAQQIFDQYPPVASNAKVAGLDAVYVLHYPPLVDRKRAADAELERVGLAAATYFMTSLNKEDLTSDIRDCLVNSQKQSGGVDSLSIKHLWAYYHTLKNKYKHVLVMEDDMHFETANVIESLQELVRSVPADYTTVHISGCLGFHALDPPKFGSHLHGPGQASRCTSGYVISEKGAKQMLEKVLLDLGGITLPADHQQNGVIDNGGYWYEPYLATQTDLGGGSSYNSKVLQLPTARATPCEEDSTCKWKLKCEENARAEILDTTPGVGA